MDSSPTQHKLLHWINYLLSSEDAEIYDNKFLYYKPNSSEEHNAFLFDRWLALRPTMKIIYSPFAPLFPFLRNINCRQLMRYISSH